MTFRNQFIILKITMHNRPFFINIHQWLSKWFCSKRLWELVKSFQSRTKLSENKKKMSSVHPNPFFSFLQSVLGQQFQSASGYTLQLHVPCRKGNMLHTQTNTSIQTSPMSKITNICVGCGETGHWKKCPKANQSNKNDNWK